MSPPAGLAAPLSQPLSSSHLHQFPSCLGCFFFFFFALILVIRRLYHVFFVSRPEFSGTA